MGGKIKQAHRTKNNVRPSSSGRTAELLGSNPQFSVYSGIKEAAVKLPLFSLTKMEELELEIDTNFQLVFKKMNKKDATTKLKALQEFADLVKHSDPEAVKAVLSLWPRLYNVLATDSDHKVREASHIAHNEVVRKVKRNLAPYLKALIAPWFTSQYDTYPPAASAANLSFNSAFPENKIEEAIAFCDQEILNYIYNNLLVETPDSLSNSTSMVPEEAEAKYERVLISSLLGYSLYLNKCDKNKIEKSIELNKRIIGSSKYWKYAKYKVNVVRSAWFKVLGSLFQRAPFLLENEENHVALATLGNIDETDPVVLPLVWQNVLMTVITLKGWSTKLNVNKLVLPKLWKVLKDGGQGNAAVIFPNLLPLLSNLLPLVDLNTFCNNLFQNLSLGLKLKSVTSSKSESNAISTTFMECLRYVIMKNESNVTLCEKLIKSNLIPTVEWCLLEPQSCYKTIFNETASLAQYWSRNNTLEHPNYFRYLNYFWSNIDSLFQQVMINLESLELENCFNISDRQIQFFQLMKQTSKLKKRLKVKFDPEDQLEGSCENKEPSKHPDQLYLKSLTDLVLKVCEMYVKIIDEKKSKQLLENLVALMREFDSENFFILVSVKISGMNQERVTTNLYENLLKCWIQCDKLKTKSLIDLIFMMFKYLSDEEKRLVLNDIDKGSNRDYLGWCLEKSLSYEYNQDLVLQEWMMSDSVSNFLVEIIEKEINDACSSSLVALFKLAVTENEKEELYVSKVAISKIIEKLKTPLDSPDNYLVSIDSCASLASHLAAVVYTEKYGLFFTDQLLITLITFSCTSKVDSDYLTPDTMWEIDTAWQDAISLLSSVLSAEELDKILEKITNLVQNFVEEKPSNRDELERFNQMLINLCRALYKGIPLEMNRVLKKLFDHSFIMEWRNSLTNLCKVLEYLNGKLSSCYDELQIESDVTMDENRIIQFFTWCFLKIDVLTATLKDNNSEKFDDEEEEEIEQLCIWSVMDSPIDWMIILFYDYELGCCFLDNCKTQMFASTIRDYNGETRSKFSQLLNSFTGDDKKTLEESLRVRCLSDSWIWCRTIYNLYVDLLTEDPTLIYDNFVKDSTINDKLMVVQLTQIFSRHLNFDYVSYTFDDINRVIVLRHLAHCTEIDVQIAEVMSKLEVFRNQDVSRFNCESLKMDWKSFQMILEIVRLFDALICYQFDSLSRRYIDLIVISLAEWMPHLVQFYKSEKIQSMIIAVTNLYQRVFNKMNEIESSEINNSLLKEWKDLFAEGIQYDCIRLWLNLAADLKNVKSSMPITTLPLLCSFASMTNCFDHRLIFKSSDEKIPRWSKLLTQSCSLLTSPLPVLQLAAYKTLMSLIPGYVEMDSRSVNTNIPNKDGLIFEQFKEICVSMQDIINTMLIGLKLGEDSCRVEPFTDSYNYTLAYLLIWDVLLTLCEKASTELKYQYADWLRQEDVLENLFNNLFRLMPSEVLQCCDSMKAYHADWFSSRVSLDPKDVCTCTKLEHMVCWIYSSTLSQLPALVRQWWSGTETKIAQIVERITSVYVSPLLCNQELTDIIQHEKKFKNMTIKVMQSIKEVVAVYTVDEAQMELVITLPTNYPLSGPDVHCNRQIGGTSHKQWLMQFKKCVLHQNGRIWDGLSLWNNNLDKKFDGVEECYICFSVLHPGTYQLPKLSCQTCKKKFHSACLYKWFSTSNKSSCPICRNLF